MKKSFFITGTDTGVGKTFIASALVHHFVKQGYKALGMKPVAAGCRQHGGQLVSEDVEQLMAVSNVTASLADVTPYAFAPAIAPHIAAEQVGVRIALSEIKRAYQALAAKADVVVVESVGGFCVPLGEDIDTADLAKVLGLPVILVVGMRLGCLNHALLTAEAIAARGLVLAGWIANQIDPQMGAFEENLHALKQRISAPCIATVLWNTGPDLASIK